MKIFIDGRLWGLENAGLGRYTVNLVRQLVKLDKKNNYSILLRKKYFDEITFPKNWEKLLGDFRHYSVTEQLKLPMVLDRIKPDVAHFLHFNAPFFYKGKFIVTIHDLLMQEHRGASATTLPLYQYVPKQIGARLVFKNAVKNSIKIIVPSNAVKKEVIEYFKVNREKVVVI